MNKSVKYIIILLCIAGCVTNETARIQSDNISIGRGLTVEAPSLTESNIAVYPQLGHSDLVWNVSLSPDNAHVLSADYHNNFINLWEIKSGRLVRTFWGHERIISALSCSPSLKTFISGDVHGIIKIWDIETGKELHTLSGHSRQIYSLDYSPDGKRFISASTDGTIAIWDAENGTELNVFGDSNEVTYAQYSPDGRYIVSSSANSLLIWDAANGRKHKILEEGKLVWSASWSPDGKEIVSVNDDCIITIWNVETGQKIKSFASGDNEKRQNAVYISEKNIVSWSYQGIKVWNTETTQKIKEIHHNESSFNLTYGRSNVPNGTHSVCISDDRRFLVTGNYATIRIIDYDSGKTLQNLNGTVSSIRSARFDRNANNIIFGQSMDSWKSIFDVRHLKMQQYGYEYEAYSTATGFSPIYYYEKHSKDGKYIVSIGITKKTIHVLDAQRNGRRLKELMQGAIYNCAAFSPDNKKVVIGGQEDNTGNIKIWEWDSKESGKILHSFSSEPTYAVSYSPDGQLIASGHYYAIKIWNADSYREMYTLRGHTNSVKTVTFSPDGKFLVSGSSDSTIRIWDIHTQKEIVCIDDGLGDINSIEYSSDGKCIIIASSDGSVYLYDVNNINDVNTRRNRRIAQIVLFSTYEDEQKESEWIIITPDGYYNASPLGDRYLNVRVGNTVSGIESYHSVFYNPDVVLARLNGRPDPASKATVTIQEAASFTPPTVVINTPARSSITSTATANLSVAITDQNQPIKNVKILVNGRLVGREELSAIRGAAGLQPEKASITVTGDQQTLNFNLPINLVDPGLNRIEVVAFNGYSESRSHVEVTWNTPAGYRPALPNMWILAVGVNKYNDSGIRDLNFCVADAKGVIASLKAQEGIRYAKVNSLLIGEGETLTPTADTIRQNLKFLDQAGDRDVILLFLAGHGLSDNAGKFLFLAQDTRLNADKTVNEATAITDGDIVSVLDRTGNLLVFIDACYSGGVDSDRLVRTLMDANAFVFTSSRGIEQSQERRDLGHGVFTYSIMQGLRGAQTAQNQGNITVISLSDFVSKDVPRITGGAQNPRGYSRGFADFPLAAVR